MGHAQHHHPGMRARCRLSTRVCSSSPTSSKQGLLKTTLIMVSANSAARRISHRRPRPLAEGTQRDAAGGGIKGGTMGPATAPPSPTPTRRPRKTATTVYNRCTSPTRNDVARQPPIGSATAARSSGARWLMIPRKSPRLFNRARWFALKGCFPPSQSRVPQDAVFPRS
jgi:hypothetical protein